MLFMFHLSIRSILSHFCFGFSIAAVLTLPCAAQQSRVVPHNQDAAPGPALSPQEAIARMTVPDGFSVELVASEPDIVNPVAMAFDERGRVWITESLEYPRREPGPGRDRVKILEDTDGDGKADKFTVFADGLNIPSGIAVGHGGVWVANSPDILFMTDTNGDDKADETHVVVTGFGRRDTHELPNSLTWGPDGWLYGLNGVFNPSSIQHQGKKYDFTCALFRIHPKTRDFELFAEGTSNPWGVAWNSEGSAFISACVIDHLWHLAETGYYHRQGGPYPPFTWKLGSIVEHKHQKAAYCGIHYFDSDAYPPEYRQRLYMGNIHGNCINVDVLERDGASYFARPAPDFLSANDAWFMPVVQKTGPDGCLYILDWYDRYHCYQDANRDPEGIDRLKGRLYRVRYQGTPRVKPFDLSRESGAELITRLSSPNVFYRDIAQRLLGERNDPDSLQELKRLVLDMSAPRKARMHALWAAVSAGPLAEGFHEQLLTHADSSYRAWGVRAAGNMGRVARRIEDLVFKAASDDSSDVRLQSVVAIRKLDSDGSKSIKPLLQAAASCGNDRILPQIVWRNLEPLLEEHAQEFISGLSAEGISNSPGLANMMPFVVDRILARESADPAPIVRLITLLITGNALDGSAARQCLRTLTERINAGEITGSQLAEIQTQLEGVLQSLIDDTGHSAHVDTLILATAMGNGAAIDSVKEIFLDSSDEELRLRALESLAGARAKGTVALARQVITNPARGSLNFRGRVLSALGKVESDGAGDAILQVYSHLEPELKPRAIELLTQRPAWSKTLLAAIERDDLPTTVLSENQVRKLLLSGNDGLIERVEETWGTLRVERDPQREAVIARMKVFLRNHEGDPLAGQKVFAKVCGQCHKMFGEGQEVGPDITSNGRNSFDQLLSNVFDPSLVIGSAYQAYTLLATDGRVLTGLLAEDNDQRVVLKTEGGKLEVVARDDIGQLTMSRLSLMPEKLEDQLKPAELADLFAFLMLDKPPEDASATVLPGLREVTPRSSDDATDFAGIIAEVAPGFTADRVGEGGAALLREHYGRPVVLRTHPLSKEKPCKLRATIQLESDKKHRLVLAVSHDRRGDWQLAIRVNGEELKSLVIGPDTTVGGWRELSVDLSRYSGQSVNIELENRANDWNYEFAYWGRAEIVHE